MISPCRVLQIPLIQHEYKDSVVSAKNWKHRNFSAKMLESIIGFQKHDQSYLRSKLHWNDTVKNSQSDVCSFFVSTIWGRMWSTVCYIVASHLQRCTPSTTQLLTHEVILHTKQKKTECKTQRMTIRTHKTGSGKLCFCVCLCVCIHWQELGVKPQYLFGILMCP